MMLKNLLLRNIIIILITIQTVNAANTKRIIAETDDGLTFTVWAQESVIKLNQDMVFNYVVKNSGKKTIFLVTETSPRVYVESNEISVAKPFPEISVNSLIRLNYNEIKRGEHFEGKMVIPFDKFKLDKLWSISFGFVYVLDKSGLDRELKSYKDPQLLSGEFNQRAITTDLGTLEVSVRK